jgi:hypothetical protein
MDFELVGAIEQIETFATGRSIRELSLSAGSLRRFGVEGEL